VTRPHLTSQCSSGVNAWNRAFNRCQDGVAERRLSIAETKHKPLQEGDDPDGLPRCVDLFGSVLLTQSTKEPFTHIPRRPADEFTAGPPIILTAIAAG
jgi:hypothetical protein